jgi:hypothetical protein
VPVTEPLSESFIRQNTKFSSLEDLLSASGFQVGTTEDFEAIPNDEWDAFMKGSTKIRELAGYAWRRDQRMGEA